MRQVLSAALLLVLAPTGCGVLGIGKAGADLETDAASVEVELALDREVYGVGAALLATVTVTNVGDAPVSVPRPSPDTTRIYVLQPGNPTPFDQQIVRWPLETVEYVTLDPGTFDRRTFLLPLTTKKAGVFEAFAVYSTEVADVPSAVKVASKPVRFEVRPEVEVERDPLGHITKAEAVKAARRHFGWSGGEARALFVKDPNLQMPVWWVTLERRRADGELEQVSCLVNPFLGRVKREVERPVPPDEKPTASPFAPSS